MRDNFPFLDSLTIPVDAGTDEQRIVITTDGALQFYDSSGNLRIQIGGPNPGDEDKIRIFSGDSDETAPSFIRGGGAVNRSSLDIFGPEALHAGPGQPQQAAIYLLSGVTGGANESRIAIESDQGDFRTDLFLSLRTLNIDAGTNLPHTTATLVAGTVTVNHTRITANSRIWLSRSTLGGTPGHLSYTLNPGVSFTINSSSATDTSIINWLIIEAF